MTEHTSDQNIEGDDFSVAATVATGSLGVARLTTDCVTAPFSDGDCGTAPFSDGEGTEKNVLRAPRHLYKVQRSACVCVQEYKKC